MPHRSLDPLRIPASFWERPDVGAALSSRDVGALFRLLRQYTGASQTQLGLAAGLDQGQVSKIMNGRRGVQTIDLLERIADGLGMPDAARVALGLAGRGDGAVLVDDGPADDELAALELTRRVEASDVGRETLERLELAVDDLSAAYAVTQPVDLLPRVRRHLAYVERLTDTRKTLDDHRRLVVAGGWFALLAATLNIDLKRPGPAGAYLAAAMSMGRHAERSDLVAWCLETHAWSALTDGDYRRALTLAQSAGRIAPRDSSIAIQAVAQQGRAWARIGDRRETLTALTTVEQMVSPLPVPEQPGRHFAYDPTKSQTYVATTLSWIGDPAAEGQARAVIDRLTAAPEGQRWPRRIASARVDLALALVVTRKPDEAYSQTMQAVASRWIVPSNRWRVREVCDQIGHLDPKAPHRLCEAVADASFDGDRP